LKQKERERIVIKINGYYEVSEELQYREFDYERERASDG
jgi:hypothetical protein